MPSPRKSSSTLSSSPRKTSSTSSSPRKTSSTSSSPRKTPSPQKTKRPSRSSKTVDAEQDEDQGNALQAALAASQLATNSTGPPTPLADGEMHPSIVCNSSEILYNSGASPLFTSIEETRWSEALELLDVVPEQAGTWVKSTGTENTTFGWSLWQRLPIHEACRRQAPAWLVAGLLNAYPAGVKQVTQFGELPIHLAVEMGAAPEVINLLLVNYYEGIHVEDNGGRTAMTINAEADVLNIEDHTYVQDSLKTAHEHLQQIEARWQKKLDDQAKANEENVALIHALHNEAIAEEKAVQKDLQKQLARMEGHVMHYKEERKALERTLSSHHVEKDEWKDILETKVGTVQSMTTKIEEKDEAVAQLTSDLNAKITYSQALEDRVAVLEHDMVKITLLQRDSIQRSLEQSEDDIQRMLASNSVLQGQLQGQTQGLQLLLHERGIYLPAVEVEVEEEEDEPDDSLNETVASEAAQAASAAINQAEYETFAQAVYDEVTDSFSMQEQSMTEEDEEQEPFAT